MAVEKIIVVTPDKHKVSVRLNQIMDDVWDTTLIYGKQVHRVGRFKGKNYAMDAATKRATQVADASPTTPRTGSATIRPAKRIKE